MQGALKGFMGPLEERQALTGSFWEAGPGGQDRRSGAQRGPRKQL